MTKGCETITNGAQCPNGGAKKANCVCVPPPRLCPECTDKHQCSSLDNTDLKRWRLQNAPEESLRTQVVKALNLLPDVHVTPVDSGRRGGNSLTEAGFADVIGRSAPDGRFIAVETKKSHSAGQRQKGECACRACRGQRVWGAELVADGGVYVPTVTSVQQAIDGVKMGLAMARGRERKAG